MIVIPMAGLSRRFTSAGYTLPKYMLPLHGRAVFAHAIDSFSALFATEPFLFITRSISDSEIFIQNECAKLGIVDIQIAVLDRETEGQAESVELGLAASGAGENEPLTIFNIDTFREKYQYPTASWFSHSDGYLEVFRGEGANWSYVGPKYGAADPIVARTTEKQPISDLCCNGLYHFARAKDFRAALQQERYDRSSHELYVAPLYNHLIKAGLTIHYDLIETQLITFCGVPAEYEAAKLVHKST